MEEASSSNPVDPSTEDPSTKDPAAEEPEIINDVIFEAEDEPVLPESQVSHHPPHMSRVPLHHPSSQIIGDPAQGFRRDIKCQKTSACL